MVEFSWGISHINTYVSKVESMKSDKGEQRVLIYIYIPGYTQEEGMLESALHYAVEKALTKIPKEA